MVNHETIAMDFATLASYTGSDVDQHVIEEIEGFVRFARSLVEATAFLGEPPILCKLGMVIRRRAGRVKHASLEQNAGFYREHVMRSTRVCNYVLVAKANKRCGTSL